MAIGDRREAGQPPRALGKSPSDFDAIGERVRET